ncbi:hypothetical protein MTO96_002103 [Rhipicephalus appendiculatus]
MARIASNAERRAPRYRPDYRRPKTTASSTPRLIRRENGAATDFRIDGVSASSPPAVCAPYRVLLSRSLLPPPIIVRGATASRPSSRSAGEAAAAAGSLTHWTRRCVFSPPRQEHHLVFSGKAASKPTH